MRTKWDVLQALLSVVCFLLVHLVWPQPGSAALPVVYRCYCPVLDGGFTEYKETDLNLQACGIGRPWKTEKEALENGSRWSCTAACPDVPGFAAGKSFRYTSGTFSRSGENTWVEKRDGDGDRNYLQVRTTLEFVELFNEQRQIHVRLLIDKALLTEDYVNGNWVTWPGSEGAWI